jgi:hypothetical protein
VVWAEEDEEEEEEAEGTEEEDVVRVAFLRLSISVLSAVDLVPARERKALLSAMWSLPHNRLSPQPTKKSQTKVRSCGIKITFFFHSLR